MTREEAIRKAESLGYTIVYEQSETEIRLRNPTVHMNASGNPQSYCRLFKGHNRHWGLAEEIDPLEGII